MWNKICGWLLRALGWTAVEPVVPENKCIILGAPHTSIMDFVISYLYYMSVGGKPYCMVKGEFFIGPLGWLLRKMGGIPVNRKNPTKMLVGVIHEMKQRDVVHLALAPEGTRKPVKRWKTGFHTIAREVGCPVYMGYFDWGTKRVGRGQKVELTDDPKADMERIQKLYEEMKLAGKNPEMYITH